MSDRTTLAERTAERAIMECDAQGKRYAEDGLVNLLWYVREVDHRLAALERAVKDLSRRGNIGERLQGTMSQIAAQMEAEHAERAEDRKKSPPSDPMDRKIVPIDGAIEAAHRAKPDPRRQYAIADIDAIKSAAGDEALEEAAKLMGSQSLSVAFYSTYHVPVVAAAIRALKSK